MKTMWRIFMILMRFIAKMDIGKIRPQVMIAIVCATIVSLVLAWFAYKMNAVEIMTAIIGSIFGFLGGTSLKILENE